MIIYVGLSKVLGSGVFVEYKHPRPHLLLEFFRSITESMRLLGSAFEAVFFDGDLRRLG